MQQLIADLSQASVAPDKDARDQAAQAVPQQIHQLYEWIGGISCGLQGTCLLLGLMNIDM